MVGRKAGFTLTNRSESRTDSSAHHTHRDRVRYLVSRSGLILLRWGTRNQPRKPATREAVSLVVVGNQHNSANKRGYSQGQIHAQTRTELTRYRLPRSSRLPPAQFSLGLTCTRSAFITMVRRLAYSRTTRETLTSIMNPHSRFRTRL